MSQSLTQSRSRLADLQAKLGRLGLPTGSVDNRGQLDAAIDYAQQTAFLARANALPILNAQSELAHRWQKEIKKVRQCDQEVVKKRQATQAWRSKLSPDDVETALSQARQFEGRFFSFLNPARWRLRSVLRRAYDFSQHQVRPSWIRILDELREEHQAVARRAETASEICNSFGLEGDFDRFEGQVSSLQQSVEKLPHSVRVLHDHVTASPEADKLVLALAALADDFKGLIDVCDEFLAAYQHCSLSDLVGILSKMDDFLDELPDYLHCLTQLNALPATLSDSIRTFPIGLPAMEAATAERSLQLAWRDRAVGRFDGSARRRQVSRLRRLGEEWQKQNAQRVREFVRQTFVDNVNTSSKPAAQLTSQQKGFKQTYNRARRELEHEFSKSMRYKSIRDLMAGDSGSVIRDLKPVWLMSPLSVSDTLPLNADNFDVVIFDEASQITLEEAVPAIFRAKQTIVVGDQMQLPPTSFFMSQRPSENDEMTFEEDGELVSYGVDSNSFLNQAARNLPVVHARVALSQPVGIADQFFQSRFLRRAIADCSRRAPSTADSASAQRRVGGPGNAKCRRTARAGRQFPFLAERPL